MSTLLQNKSSENLHEQIAQALVTARQLTQFGNIQQACIAWDIVEELLAEASDQKSQSLNNFEQYCQDNPWADESRSYEI